MREGPSSATEVAEKLERARPNVAALFAHDPRFISKGKKGHAILYGLTDQEPKKS